MSTASDRYAGIPFTELTRSVRRVELENGLRVLLRRLPTDGVVAIQTYVCAGYVHEEDQDSGLAHLLEHMWFKGSEALPEEGALQRTIKALGGVCNAGTIYDHTRYYFVLPATELEVGLGHMADVFRAPLFDAERMEREIEVVIEESNRKKDRPTAYALERGLALAFRAHRVRRWRIGSDEVLRAVTTERLRSFWDARYRPGNMILAVSGDLDEESTLALVRRHFGGLEPAEVSSGLGPDEPPQLEPRVQQEEGDIAQGYSTLMFRSVPGGHDDEIILDVIGALLAGGASARLPEHAVGPGLFQGLTSCGNLGIPQVGCFLVQGLGNPDSLQAGEDSVLAQLSALRQGDLSDWELKRVLHRVETGFFQALQDAGGVASVLASSEADASYREPDRYLHRLRSVTVDDVVRVAREIFRGSQASLFRYVPRGSSQPLPDPAVLAVRVDRTSSVGPYAFSRPPLPPPRTFRPATADGAQWGEQIQLANGATLVGLVDRNLPLASFGLSFRGGRKDEGIANRGISDLALRTALRGTQDRGAMALAGDMEFLGTGFGYSVGGLSSSYAFECLSRALPSALGLLADVIGRPRFEEAELERERALQLSELRSYEDQTGAQAGLAFRQALYGEAHRYTWWTEGSSDSVSALTVNDCREFFARLTHPGRMIFTVAGDVDLEQLAHRLEQLFPLPGTSMMPVPQHPDPQLYRGARSRMSASGKAQSGIFLGYPTVSNAAPERFGLLLLSSICSGLAGRFGAVLRTQKSLAYTVSAGSSIHTHSGFFYGFLSSDFRKQEEAIDGLRMEFARLHEGLDDEEVERARSYLLGSYPLGRQHLSSRRSALLSYTLMDRPLNYSEQYKASIRAVTRQDLQALIERFLNPGEEVLGVLQGGREQS